MYSVCVNKNDKRVLVIAPNGTRQYIPVDGTPIFAVVQGDELHTTLENGHVEIRNVRTSAMIRTIIG